MDYWQLGLLCISLTCIRQTPARPRRGPLAGPYKLVPKQLADCPNKGTNELRIVSSKLRKIGRDIYSYSSDVILPHGLTDEITFGIRCATYGNGGWKENAYNFHFGKACTTLKNVFPEVYELVKKEFRNIQDCPIPQGNYTIRNATFKAGSLKGFATLFYDEYRTDLYFQRNGKRVGCKRIFYDVFPKKKV